jgi:hypothetical protein
VSVRVLGIEIKFTDYARRRTMQRLPDPGSTPGASTKRTAP